MKALLLAAAIASNPFCTFWSQASTEQRLIALDVGAGAIVQDHPKISDLAPCLRLQAEKLWSIQAVDKACRDPRWRRAALETWVNVAIVVCKDPKHRVVPTCSD